MRRFFASRIAATDAISLQTPQEILNEGPIPLLGYDQHLLAGKALCYAVANNRQKTASVLVFGPPGTGKSAYARELAFSMNDLARSRNEDHALFTLVTIHAARLASESTVQMIRKQLMQVEEKRIPDHLPAIIVVDELDALAPPREGTPQHREMAMCMMSFLDSLPNKTVTLWTTDYPGRADPALLGRIRLTLFFDVPSQQTADSLLRYLNVPNGDRVASLLYDEGFNARSRYSGRDLAHAVSGLRKIDPRVFDASPQDIAESIAAGCRPQKAGAIKQYREEYHALILQSKCVLQRYTKLYEEFFGDTEASAGTS